jgi:hypothetical protein
MKVTVGLYFLINIGIIVLFVISGWCLVNGDEYMIWLVIMGGLAILVNFTVYLDIKPKKIKSK